MLTLQFMQSNMSVSDFESLGQGYLFVQTMADGGRADELVIFDILFTEWQNNILL